MTAAAVALTTCAIWVVLLAAWAAVAESRAVRWILLCLIGLLVRIGAID